jgi:parallel beta-helix repeat protein
VAFDRGRGNTIRGLWAEHTATQSAVPTEVIRIGSASYEAVNTEILGTCHLHPIDAADGTPELYALRLVNSRGLRVEHLELTNELPSVAAVRVDATVTNGTNIIERISIGDTAPAGWDPRTKVLSNASAQARPVIIRAVPDVAGSPAGSILSGTPAPGATYTVSRPAPTASTYLAVDEAGHVYRVGYDTATTSGLREVLAAVDGPNRHVRFGPGRFHFLDAPLGSETWASVEDHYTWGSAAEPSSSGLSITGAGMTATIISNRTNWSGAADTEPLSFTNSQRVTIRDLTVESCGSLKSSTDAIDFDQGANCLVERVRITRARGRAVVVDGGDRGKHGDGTVLRGVEVYGRPPRPETVGLTGGTLATGTTYRYAVSWVDADLGGAGVAGETKVSEVTAVGGSTAYRVQLPIGAYSTTARKLYRAPAGSTAWVLVATVNDNTTTTYTDTGAAGTAVTMPVSTASSIQGTAGLEILGTDSAIVTGCWVEGVSGFGINLVRKGSGATLATSDRNRVVGNTVRGCGSYGLRVYGGSHNLVADNHVINATGAAIRVDGTTGQESTANVFSGNILADDQDVNSPSAGVTTTLAYQTTASTVSNRFLDNLAIGVPAGSIATGTTNTERLI